MQIVIEIPEDHKRVIDNLVIDGKGYLLPYEVEDTLAKAVKIGTPLPKGHGKLKDADAMIKHVANLPKCPNGHSEVYDEAMIINMINDELTIIEADKTGSENP